MQLPAHLQKKKSMMKKPPGLTLGGSEPPSQPAESTATTKKEAKYSDTAVKMLANALDDVNQIKFKKGWFTLIKYEEAIVDEKKPRPHLRDELVQHAKEVAQKRLEPGNENYLVKPRTWMQDHNIQVVNKFLIEAKQASIQQANAPQVLDSRGFKSQSKVAAKRQRANQKQSSSKAPAFKKKFALKLGGDALDQDDLEEEKKEPHQQPSQMKIVQPPVQQQIPANPIQVQAPKVVEKIQMKKPPPSLNLNVVNDQAKNNDDGPPTRASQVDPIVSDRGEPLVEQDLKQLNVLGTKPPMKILLSQQYSNERIEFFLKVTNKRIKRQFLQKLRAHKQQCIYHEFKTRLHNYFEKNVSKRKMRAAFERMKITMLTKQIEDVTQDKYQIYLRYARRMIHVCESRVMTRQTIYLSQKQAFLKWKTIVKSHKDLDDLVEQRLQFRAQKLEDDNFEGVGEMVERLGGVKQVDIGQEAVELMQNSHDVMYLAEMRDNTEFKIAKAQVLYPLLFAKLEKIQTMHKLNAFTQIKKEGFDVYSHSLRTLKKIKQNIVYLQTIKQSLQKSISRTTNQQQTRPVTILDSSQQVISRSEVKPPQNVKSFDNQTFLTEKKMEPYRDTSGFSDGQNLSQSINSSSEQQPSSSKYANADMKKVKVIEVADTPSTIVKIKELTSLNSSHINTTIQVINPKQIKRQPRTPSQNNDRDTQYLIHINRQIMENIALMKLFKKIQIQYLNNRSVTEAEQVTEDEDVQRIAEGNAAKLHAVAKMYGSWEKAMSLRINGDIWKSKSVISMFKQWKNATQKENQNWEVLREAFQKNLRLKCAVAKLSQSHLNPRYQMMDYFMKWKKEMILGKQIQRPQYRIPVSKNQQRGYGSYDSRQVVSHNISYKDQIMNQKIVGFMKIKKLLLEHYISKGTILQKHINFLKDMAGHHPAGGSVTRNRKPLQFGTLDSQQQVQPMFATRNEKSTHMDTQYVEQNVNRIIRAIYRIIFNKWVMFSHHQIKTKTEPRQIGVLRLFESMHGAFISRKLHSFTKMHLYNLKIQSKLNSSMQDEDVSHNKIARLSLLTSIETKKYALFLMVKASRLRQFKAVIKYFWRWRDRSIMFEWRMSQSVVSADSNALRHLFQRVKDRPSNPQEINDETPDRGLLEIDVDEINLNHQMVGRPSALQPESTPKQQQNFFENYFTPTSAAMHQKMQKPWDVKERREHLKHLCIMSAARQADNMLNKPYNEVNPSLQRMTNVRIDKVKLARTFTKWQKTVIEMRSKLQKREQQVFYKILKRIQKNKLQKRFTQWKFLLKMTEDTYPFQVEMIDHSTILTLSTVGQQLQNDIDRKKAQYKREQTRRILTRLFEFMRTENPVKNAFMMWKEELCVIEIQAEELKQSQDEKEQLRHQYEIICQQNLEIKNNFLQNIYSDHKVKDDEQCCDLCREMKVEKLDAMTRISYNQEAYQQLQGLVGHQAMRSLLTPFQQEQLLEMSEQQSSNQGSVMHIVGQQSDSNEGLDDTVMRVQDNNESNDFIVQSQQPLRRQNSHVENSGLQVQKEEIRRDRKKSMQITQASGDRGTIPQPVLVTQGSQPLKYFEDSENDLARKSEQDFRYEQIPQGGGAPQSGIITGAGGQADELAHMIEHENQRLRDKSHQIRDQYHMKQQQVQQERQRYLEKIKMLKERRDMVMNKYQQNMIQQN